MWEEKRSYDRYYENDILTIPSRVEERSSEKEEMIQMYRERVVINMERCCCCGR